MASVYLWAKVFHLLCVMGWVASIFVQATALRFLANGEEKEGGRERFVVLGLGAYRMGHHLFGWAVVLGLILWLYVGIGGGWLHVKLALVSALLAHFMIGGRRLKRIRLKGEYPSRRWTIWYARLPVALLLTVVWLVLGKPF